MGSSNLITPCGPTRGGAWWTDRKPRACQVKRPGLVVLKVGIADRPADRVASAKAVVLRGAAEIASVVAVDVLMERSTCLRPFGSSAGSSPR